MSPDRERFPRIAFNFLRSLLFCLLLHLFFQDSAPVSNIESYTVKLARAKLPANAGNFTCSSQVKRSLARFTCVTCSLPVITGKFTCFEAASTSRGTHAHCLRAHVNLPEYHRYFTGSFTCRTHANLPATSMQNCLLLQAKIHATYRQNTGIAGKNTRTIAGKKTCNSTQNYLQLQAICHHTAGKFTCKLLVS